MYMGMSLPIYSLPKVKNVFAPSTQRTVEAVWEETDVYRLRRFRSGTECHAAAFPIHSLAKRYGADAGWQWLPGPAICVGVDRGRDHAGAPGHPLDALVRRFGGWRSRSERGRGRHLANDTVAAHLAIPAA